MQVKLWGVRGSIPSPLSPRDYRNRITGVLEQAGELWRNDPSLSVADIEAELPSHLRDLLGSETTCVELLDGKLQLIFDIGTGARKLGHDMLARGVKGEIHILVTHTHWDHIQGWPFFAPGYIPTNHIHFYSCLEDCEDRFVRQQSFDFFPLRFHEMMSKREFHLFEQGEDFKIGGLRVRTESLIHPGRSTAYRIEKGKKSFIFATDTEFFGPALKETIAEKKPFFEGADVLLMDAQYTLEESAQKIGWGHTSMTVAVDCAVAWNIGRLVLTHHEPTHDDQSVWKMYEEAKHYLKISHRSKLELVLAREGDILEV